MDEISFRLSSQIETLQIQTLVNVQHCQYLLGIWLSQGQCLLQDLAKKLHGEDIKEFIHQIFIWLQKQVHTVNYHLSSVRLNPRYILDNFLTLEVSKREFLYFLTGLSLGSVIGYSIALNWHTPRHLHSMKAIVCHHYIGIEGVSMIEDAEMPTIQKSNELLIQVKAASIHEVDIKICSGYARAYRRLLNNGRHKDLPVTLGRDCAGIVIDIGQSVIDFDIGDKVFLAVPSWSTGTMSDYIVVPETRVVKMPKNLPFEASASLPYSGCLALDALTNHSVIKQGNAKGKRVLIYGGTTSVGCILIQLIKLWSGHVTTICRSPAAAVVKALGAHDIIVSNESDIFKELELRDKFDAIFYTGGSLTDVKILKKFLLPNGSYISTVPEYLISDSLGYLSGSLFSGFIRVRLLLHYVFGASNFNWKEGSKLITAHLQSLQELADADQLQPILDRIYAPHNIDQALLHAIDSNAIGSTVIKFQ